MSAHVIGQGSGRTGSGSHFGSNFTSSGYAGTGPAVVTRPGWFRRAWRSILRVVQEMNYGARRAVEVQAPWIDDPQWHRR